MGANARRRIVIAGAGIGGLTAALAFARTGAQVTVKERAAEIRETGAGLQITPNGAIVLDKLGLGPAMADRGLVGKAVVPTDARTGRQIARFDLTRLPGQPYRFFHRQDLMSLLVEACREAGVQIDTGVTLTPEAASALGADLCVGADGLHSQTRQSVATPSTPFFTGQVAWRATIAGQTLPEAQIWMGAGQHVVTYPLPGNRLNIVAVQERADWAAEGWAHPDRPEHLQAAFAHSCASLRAILARVEVTHLWGLFRHPVADRWWGPGVALLGDAAHPTLPFLAQGANLAIEDAWVMAACCNADPQLDQALERYQTLRRPRVTRAIRAANANAANYHLSGARKTLAQAALGTLGRVAPQAFLRRMDWLYGYDATRI